MTENENKSNDTTTESNNDNDHNHIMEIDSLNERLQTINISDENDKEDTKAPKAKRGQAKVAEMILKNSTLVSFILLYIIIIIIIKIYMN